MRAVGARVAVFVSGAGTNLQILLDDAVVAPWIALVVSDREDAPALERARERGVETSVLGPDDYLDRTTYTIALRDLLVERGVEYVVNAGFMRILAAEFAEAFAGRWLNLHPALLPAFPGAHAVRDALAWGVKVTGVTVHLADEEVDHGPIVMQEAVPVLPNDDWDTLEARIHEAEHRLLPAAVRALVQGRLKVEGRIVRVLEGPGP